MRDALFFLTFNEKMKFNYVHTKSKRVQTIT